MAPKRRDVYRGRHRLRFPVTLVVSVVLILIIAAVVLFYSLQKYAVYGKDGVTLAIPGLTEAPPVTESAAPAATQAPTQVNPVQAELVIEEADYSAVDLSPGEGLRPVRGKYLSNTQLLTGAAGGLGVTAQEDAAVVLEMVTPEGVLSWASESEIARGYGVNGQAELSELAAALKDRGYYLVAEVNCCRATLLAKRYPALALRNAADEPYVDTLGGWLDPYDLRVRSYLLALTEELAEAGFDEILYSGLSFPENDAVVHYASEHLGATTPRAAVSGLAVYLARHAPEGVRLGVTLERSALYGASDPEKEAPQDAALFARLFDRLYLRTDAANLEADAAKVSALSDGDMTLRFVPLAAADTGTACCFTETAD